MLDLTPAQTVEFNKLRKEAIKHKLWIGLRLVVNIVLFNFVTIFFTMTFYPDKPQLQILFAGLIGFFSLLQYNMDLLKKQAELQEKLTKIVNQ